MVHFCQLKVIFRRDIVFGVVDASCTAAHRVTIVSLFHRRVFIGYCLENAFSLGVNHDVRFVPHAVESLVRNHLL